MSRIFLSYSRNDQDTVLAVSQELKALGHEITVDVDSVQPGQDWRKVLANGLRASEVYVVFLSERALASPFVLSEIGAARAYAEGSERMLMIPVVIDHVSLPSIIDDILVLSAINLKPRAVAQKIDMAVSKHFGSRVAKEEEQAAFSRIVEENSATYIEEAIASQSRNERRHRFVASLWYSGGFLSLIAGLFFVVLGITEIASITSGGWAGFAIVALKSFVVVGLLGACSKYAFTLGKSYMSESLKCADRMHAIGFGKFYLKVYGANASWPEVREAFQHWNIDRNSVFASLGAADFDPKLIEGVLELLKIANSKVEKK